VATPRVSDHWSSRRSCIESAPAPRASSLDPHAPILVACPRGRRLVSSGRPLLVARHSGNVVVRTARLSLSRRLRHVCCGVAHSLRVLSQAPATTSIAPAEATPTLRLSRGSPSYRDRGQSQIAHVIHSSGAGDADTLTNIECLSSSPHNFRRTTKWPLPLIWLRLLPAPLLLNQALRDTTVRATGAT
jgi:hypothetical protein